MNRQTPPPPAEGVRLRWSQIPARVRGAVEGWLGSRVVEAESQPTGFSPGLAARLTTASGRRVFVKAVGPEPNALAPSLHRKEAAKVAGLKKIPSVPDMLWSYDEGEGGWVALAFQDIEGRTPAQPWRMDEFDRVIEALVTLSHDLTPSPLPPESLGTASDQFATELCGWQELRKQQTDHPGGLDSWSARNLEKMARIEATAAEAADGDTLLHLDIRADNILLSPERVWLVDWPGACVGAPWVDILAFAPSVAMQGGPEPEDVIVRHPACRAANADAVTAVIAAIAGFFTYQSLQSPPPGLPTVRAFQAAQGRVAREWLARRTGWD
jgi:aminoglycoside phosphotransferase (APT) family kinase protein